MRDILAAISQVRDWFKVTWWTGFKYHAYDFGRYSELKFESRDLPEAMEDVVGLTGNEYLV
ncbi:hypothetical protein PsYK624_162090 [Phanerochaete sordida]|uniref:Uncharacterized protein n=1 Tax=Phanerochaete sordida TaxID=48140 RepID=A0A9P3GQD9_9APHY|nr:hypothetical protein PsYK624_162090 [Phanerochaete sordida]